MAVIPSPLSNSIQGINQSTVSGSIFGGNKVDAQTQSSINANTSAVASMQKQVNELSQTNAQILSNLTQIGSFQAQVDSVRLQLNGISDTLQSVATITASESAIERQKDLYEQENQKKLAEAGARGGQEGLLETKIQSALSEPVKRIGGKISFGFDNLMKSIWTLLGGWLTTQGINVLKALQDDDKKKLNEIKDSVIKTLLVAGGVFTIINVGIVKVISTITGLVAKIGKFVIGGLIIKPFQTVMSGLGNAASGIFRGNKPPTPPSPGNKGPKPSGGGLLSGIGKVITGLSGAMDFLNGEKVDAALAALTFVPGGGVFKGLRAASTAVYTFDQIAEFLGGNLTGADPKVLKEKRKKLEEEKNKDKDKDKDKNKLTSSPLKKDEPPKPAAAKPAPTTSMTPPASNLQINAPKTPKEDKTATAPAGTTPTPATTPEPAGTNSTPASAPTPPAATPATTSASAPEPAPSATAKAEPAQVSAEMPKEQPKVSTEAKPAETSSKPSTPDITPAQTTKMQTVPFNIGPEPEPKPNVVYAPSASSAPQQQQPSSTGAASDVPSIPSSNTDNFYTLYSQINYNVVL
jgi:hypothetical protein